MKDQTLRTIRVSLLGQRTVKNRVLEGYAQQKERMEDEIRAARARISQNEDNIRQISEDIKKVQEEIHLIVDAYHDLWDDEPPEGNE